MGLVEYVAFYIAGLCEGACGRDSKCQRRANYTTDSRAIAIHVRTPALRQKTWDFFGEQALNIALHQRA
jgi:hypothetical protein